MNEKLIHVMEASTPAEIFLQDTRKTSEKAMEAINMKFPLEMVHYN